MLAVVEVTALRTCTGEIGTPEPVNNITHLKSAYPLILAIMQRSNQCYLQLHN